MTLVADNQILQIDNAETMLNPVLERWRASKPSRILHHGKACCSTAREWLFSMDHSELSGQHKLTGPRWLRKKYKWGPSCWPMTWCEAIDQKVLDCGALADLSRNIFDARGIRCYSVQLIQQYTEDTTTHWEKKWSDRLASTHWIQKEFIYHEACAVEINASEIRVWDPSAASWANPVQHGGYGAVVAIRLTVDSPYSIRELRWGQHLIECGKWQTISWRPSTSKTNRLARIEDLISSPFTTLTTGIDLHDVKSV
jgi:hypothetical protein